MVVLIMDLYESGLVHDLVQYVTRIVQNDNKVLILGVLTTNGAASFDEGLGRRLTVRGAWVGVTTPYELASWVAEVVR